mgnify:CR=1 FL=1|tara:strand:- start:32610 stop:33041 length:432 start_codon:yes stop_codon:yes gene_type:complete
MSKPTPKNKVLYEKAKQHANAIYGGTTSAYKSMFIVKTYKSMGGTYTPRRSRTSSGTKRWLREKWIMVEPFVTKQERKTCGTVQRRKHACRPSVRVSSKTPMTVQETIQKHGRSKVVALARRKQSNSEAYRINWNKGTLKRIY